MKPICVSLLADPILSLVMVSLSYVSGMVRSSLCYISLNLLNLYQVTTYKKFFVNMLLLWLYHLSS
jgi:hypothetical protein